eukprot:SAG31_NODE_225_length_19846_cov_19.057983_9_plen_44_part_00
MLGLTQVQKLVYLFQGLDADKEGTLDAQVQFANSLSHGSKVFR